LCRAKRARCTSALATALLVLGDSLRKLGEEGQARLEYEAALTVTGSHATSPVAGELSARLGRLDKAAGNYESARRRYERARDVAARRLGADSRRVADILLLLAQVARKLGAYEEAEARATEARTLLVRHVGEAHADVAEVDLELSLIHKKQGKYAEALRVAETALATSESALGVGHERVVAGLMLVGDVLRKLDRFADARRRYTDALNTVASAASTSEIERRGEIRQKLGILAKKEAHYEEASRLLGLALVDLERTRGADHYKVALAQADLADVARKQHQDRRDLYRSALATLRRTFGDSHEEVADVLHRLALAEAEFGSRTSAFELLREAMTITEGDTDYRRGTLLADAAYLAGVDGRTRVADDLFAEALTLLETALGGESGEVADALTKRAQVDASLGRARAAAAAATRALSVYRDRMHLDDSHYKVQQAMTLAGP
jgi:tetratricopeptide (TPR) repeat protein